MVSRSALPSGDAGPENFGMTISLVTGANKGIGFEIARGIGGTVLVGARDDTRGRAAETALREAGVDAHHLRLDVTDQDTIDAAVKWVADTYGSLDVLVNNAGCPALDWDVPPSEVSLDAVRRTYDTNVVGVIAVTNAFLPLLREAPAARIVNVSSRLASLTLGADENSPVSRVNLLAYNSSKAALNSITQAYAKELRGTPVKVNAVNPGFCATDMAAGMARYGKGMRTAEEGARPVIAAALLTTDGPTGTFFDESGPLPW